MLKRIVKTVSILIVACIAVIGVLFDLRNETAILTEWGVAAIVATVLSAVTAIGIEAIEYVEEIRARRLEAHRVDTQRRQLEEIRANLLSKDYPLVPFRLFYTLRHTAPETQIEKYFRGVEGYKSLRKSDILKFVGTARIGDTPFNPEDEEPTESHCTLNDQELIEDAKKNSGSRNTIVKIPATFVIKIGTDTDEPNVVLEATFEAGKRPGSIPELRLYDTQIYQDGMLVNWKIKLREEQSYSTRDLRNATIKVTADFWHCDEDSPPAFSNLHLYFGERPTSFLFLTRNDLEGRQRTYRRNPMEGIATLQGELAQELFRTLAIELTLNVSDEIFNNQLRQYAS